MPDWKDQARRVQRRPHGTDSASEANHEPVGKEQDSMEHYLDASGHWQEKLSNLIMSVPAGHTDHRLQRATTRESAGAHHRPPARR